MCSSPFMVIYATCMHKPSTTHLIAETPVIGYRYVVVVVKIVCNFTTRDTVDQSLSLLYI